MCVQEPPTLGKVFVFCSSIISREGMINLLVLLVLPYDFLKPDQTKPSIVVSQLIIMYNKKETNNRYASIIL